MSDIGSKLKLLKHSILGCYLLLILLPAIATGQVAINEICSRNGSTIRDEDEDYEDWVELYNRSPLNVNLKGYYLSDDKRDLKKWQFPEINIPSAGYLVVMASGKDRLKPLDKGASAAHAEEKWVYLVTALSPENDWLQIGFNSSDWMTTFVDEGTNDGDGFPVFAPPGTSVYLRKKLVIFDFSLLKSALLATYSDALSSVVVNGVEVKMQTIVEDKKNKDPFDPDKGIYDVFPLLREGLNIIAVKIQNDDQYRHIFTPDLTVALAKEIPSYLKKDFEHARFYLQTNFKLSAKGETLFLSAPDGSKIDEITFPPLPLDISYGSIQDGSNDRAFFYQPSPGLSNNSHESFKDIVDVAPEFSEPAGYCKKGTKLELKCPSLAKIKYTLDGSIPDFKSSDYLSSLIIDSTVVIRARCFESGKLPSEVVTHTYLLEDNSSLPVVSISTNPANLWDSRTGIFAPGKRIDLIDNIDVDANYWENWIIPAHVELFQESGKTGFEGDYGIKLHGAASRQYPQKSLRVIASKTYGDSKIKYRIFPDKEIDSFKRFLLRNSGNEWNQTHFRDAFVSRMMSGDTYNEVQAYQPCIAFINGQYWGIMNLREQVGRYYVEENFGIKGKHIDLIERTTPILGNRLDFDKMIYFILHSNMSDQKNYEQVESMLDIENYVDYLIAEVFYNNTDWPANNVKLWKERSPEGKWRYVLYDFDLSMGNLRMDEVEDAHVRLFKRESVHTEIFTALIKNAVFRQYFVTRYADLLNTLLLPEKQQRGIQDIKAGVEKEMPRHLDRWGLSVNAWNEEIDKVLNFLKNRPAQAWNYLKQLFKLADPVTLKLNIQPEGSGKIKVNTVIPDNYPFKGKYFTPIPVRLEAVPNTGFKFASWQTSTATGKGNSITLHLESDSSFTFNFVPAKGR